MKRSRYTEEQIIGVLREHEAGAKAADPEGEPAGRNRICRLYREQGLSVRRRRARRRAVGTRAPILVEAQVNARWSLDFVHD